MRGSSFQSRRQEADQSHKSGCRFERQSNNDHLDQSDQDPSSITLLSMVGFIKKISTSNECRRKSLINSNPRLERSHAFSPAEIAQVMAHSSILSPAAFADHGKCRVIVRLFRCRLVPCIDRCYSVVPHSADDHACYCCQGPAGLH